jgi:hypothetical protein
MSAAETEIENRSSFIRTSQLCLRKCQFLLLTLRALLVGACTGAFLILGCKSLSSRSEFLAEFGWELFGRWDHSFTKEEVYISGLVHYKVRSSGQQTLVHLSTAVAFHTRACWNWESISTVTAELENHSKENCVFDLSSRGIIRVITCCVRCAAWNKLLRGCWVLYTPGLTVEFFGVLGTNFYQNPFFFSYKKAVRYTVALSYAPRLCWRGVEFAATSRIL